VDKIELCEKIGGEAEFPSYDKARCEIPEDIILTAGLSCEDVLGNQVLAWNRKRGNFMLCEIYLDDLDKIESKKIDKLAAVN